MLVLGVLSGTIIKETGMDAQATFSYSSTQSDVGPVAELPGLPHCAAQRLLPRERRNLAIQVLAGAQPVSDLAREHEVSRKFLYQQAHTAEEALSEAFAPSSRSEDVEGDLRSGTRAGSGDPRTTRVAD